MTGQLQRSVHYFRHILDSSRSDTPEILVNLNERAQENSSLQRQRLRLETSLGGRRSSERNLDRGLGITFRKERKKKKKL